MLECYYVFFRTWEFFSPDSNFPFERFNDVHDDDMPSALEKFARDWRRDHTVELGKRRQKEAKELVAKLSKRAKQRTASPDAHYRTPRSNTATKLLEPAQNFSLGCRIAYEVGWLQELLPRFGDRSPSKRHFFMRVESKERATTVVKCLVKGWAENIVPPKDDWRDYAPLNLRFGCVSASQLGEDRQVSAEWAIKKVRAIKKVPAAGRGDLIELFQERAADCGMELAQIVGDILKREAEESGTPADAAPVADQTEAGDTAAPGVATAEKPAEDKQGSKDSAGEDGTTQDTKTRKVANVGRDVDHLKSWEPPKGYVRVSTILSDERFQKKGKSPSRSSIQRWEEKEAPAKIERDPANNENCYAEEWVMRRLKEWNPQLPKTQ